MTGNRYPTTAPLDLHGDDLRRYEQVRILRRFVDPTGERPIRIDKDSTVRKGQVASHNKPIDPNKWADLEERKRESFRKTYAKRKPGNQRKI